MQLVYLFESQILKKVGRWKVGLIDFFILLLYHSPTFAPFFFPHIVGRLLFSCLTVFLSISLLLCLSQCLSIIYSKAKNKTECLNPSGSVVACHLVPRMLASLELPSVPLFVTEVLVWGIASGTWTIHPSVRPSKEMVRESERGKSSK